MFTARNFLRSPNTKAKWAGLHARLSRERDRLGKEFLAIAADPGETESTRTSALVVLFAYAKVLRLPVADAEAALDGIFEHEVGPERLHQMAAALRKTPRVPSAVFAFQAALAFAELSPKSGTVRLKEVLQALRGSALEPGLAAAVARIGKRGQAD
jgi:hypothetical protein